MRVSSETIYQAVVHARGELKHELARSLRRGRGARKPHRDPQSRTGRFVDPITPLAERPAEVEDRIVPRHWEGDLIVGGRQRSAVATLVERTTRYTILGHLPVERTAEAVRDSLVVAFADLPADLRRTLTWDQGAEMSEHRSFAAATNMQVYFATLHRPARGTNENTNGLLRQYLPKGSDLSAHGPSDLAAMAAELNGPSPESPRLGHPGRTLRCFSGQRIDQTVATIAGIRAAEGKLYLCAIKDVCPAGSWGTRSTRG
jgi:IS30 family transposase